MRACKVKLAEVDEAFNSDLAHDAWKRIVAQRKKYRGPFELAITLVEARGGAYTRAEQERIEDEHRRLLEKADKEAREAAEKARAEQEAEHAAQAEKERQEAAEREKKAAAAYKAGERGRAKELREQAEHDAEMAEARREQERQELEDKAAEASLVAPIELAPLATPERVTIRKKEYTYQIIAPLQIPRKYLCPDEELIAKTIRALGPKAEIPGVKVVEKAPKMIVRK